MKYEIIHKHGHVVVMLNGRFLFSADTEAEAQKEIDKLEAA